MRRKYLILLPRYHTGKYHCLFPELVEKIYAGGLYPFIGQGLSIATGLSLFPWRVNSSRRIFIFLISLIRLINY